MHAFPYCVNYLAAVPGGWLGRHVVPHDYWLRYLGPGFGSIPSATKSRCHPSSAGTDLPNVRRAHLGQLVRVSTRPSSRLRFLGSRIPGALRGPSSAGGMLPALYA